MRRRANRSQVIAGVVLLWLAHAARVHARAGGGGNFSGGGGGGGHSGGSYSGGHSSGGGSGDSDLSLIVFALIILFFIVSGLWQWYQTETARREADAIERAAAAGLAQRLRQNDPTFDAERFYARVSGAFLKIQAAWSAQDVRPMQPFVSDGVAERFGLQFREQQDLGYRNQMDQVRVRSVILARVTDGEVFEAATVRIDASAIDYNAQLSDGKPLGPAKSPESFTEYWTFLRRSGASSPAGDGLFEGRCPNCGAAIRVAQHVNCEHCGALLRSGRYDWVLVEITQASEWRPQTPRATSGIEPLRQSDPELALETLEDRAAVIFWRRAEARRVADAAVLRKVALAQFAADDPTIDDRQQATRRWLGEIGVGAIDVAGFSVDETHDRAAVHVSFSGTHFTQRRGAAVERGKQTLVIRETFTLVRRRGERSDSDRGITSAHCPGCGAPLTSDADAHCASCGRVLNDGSAGWVLAAIEKGWKRPAASTAPLAVEPSPRGLLNHVIATAAADGQIDAGERALIKQFAARAAVQPGEVDALIAAAGAGQLDAPAPADREETHRWLTAMIGVALVDGRVEKREAALLRTVAARAGLGAADLRLLIRKEQARRHAAGRTALRELRSRR